MKEITGEDLQKELDLLKEVVDKIKWQDRWDRNDAYLYIYAMRVIDKIEETKRKIRELLEVID